MSRRVPWPRATTWSAVAVVVLASALLFRAWLRPPEPSLWLGAWLTALCH